jgi:flavin-dependent dehydrogenase
MPAQADVAIAGAGPAGAACAIELARAGFDVVLVEQAAFPRHKTCGEYLNAGAVRLLDALGVLASVRAQAGRVERLTIADRAGRSVSLPFCGESLSYPRADLDALLAAEAVRSGARTIRGRAIALRKDAGGRTCGLEYRDASGEARTLGARAVVAADGAQSLLAQAAGLRRRRAGPRRFAIGGHYEDVAPPPGELSMIVDGAAYLAVNPLTADCSNVMLVLPGDRVAPGTGGVEAFVREQMEALGGIAFGRAPRIGPRAGFGPLESFVRRASAPGLLLAGDAAGMIDPFTGQGVFLALRSGRAAARAIAALLAAPAAEAALLDRYASDHARDLALRRRACALVKTIVATPALARFASARLANAPDRAAPLLAAVSGVARIESAFSPRVLLGLVA